ncbi:MAG TPA: helix-hairpin-helix domain-containing protein [Cytophagales bacterium]|nr:helix-hairpin-helix domain-containing protein [Cytophagales bacterium]
MNNSKDAFKELRRIPGVGKAVAMDLWQLGYRTIQDLKGQDPELMYILHNDLKQQVQDVCMLYTFRCAVYYANTYGQYQDPEKLKWWRWTDSPKVDSITKDAMIRKEKVV